jgi:hypothetical protein
MRTRIAYGILSLAITAPQCSGRIGEGENKRSLAFSVNLRPLILALLR